MHHEIKLQHEKSPLPAEDVWANLEPVEKWKSPEHLRLLERKREDVLSKLDKTNQPKDFDIFLPLPTTFDEPAKVAPREVKEKIKTRGEAATQTTEEQGNGSEESPATPSPKTVTVSRKNLITFRAMFPSTAEERLKTMDWETFVSAMTDIGFAARNGGGSMVIFENADGKIVFHKPHPVAKIDPVMFQAMGRRMNRWFGWTRDTFTLDEK